MATSFFDIAGVSSELIPETADSPLGYADNLTDKKAVDLLKNQEFINDAVNYYQQSEGKTFNSNEEVIDHFFTDRRWHNLNSIGLATELLDANGMEASQGQRLGRLQRVYDAMPIAQDGFGGFMEATGAVLADPVNLIGLGTGAAAGKAAGLAAQAAGKTAIQAGKAGVIASAKKGFVAEGAINTGIEGGFDAATQHRDIELGLRTEYSAAQGALAAATGGVFGGVLGGAGGAVSAIGKGKKGFDIGEADDLAKSQLAEAERVELAMANGTHPDSPMFSQMNSLNERIKERTSYVEDLRSQLDEDVVAGVTPVDGDAPTRIQTAIDLEQARLDVLREMTQYPKRQAEITGRMRELTAQASTSKEAVEELNALAREQDYKTTLFERLSKGHEAPDLLAHATDVDAAVDHAVSTNFGNKAAEAPRQIADSRGDLEVLNANPQGQSGTTAGANPGVVRPSTPDTQPANATSDGEPFRYTPEQAADDVDADLLTNEFNMLSREPAQALAVRGLEDTEANRNSLQTFLNAKNDQYEKLTGERLEQPDAINDIAIEDAPEIVNVDPVVEGAPKYKEELQSEISTLRKERNALVKNKARKSPAEQADINAKAAEMKTQLSELVVAMKTADNAPEFVTTKIALPPKAAPKSIQERMRTLDVTPEQVANDVVSAPNKKLVALFLKDEGYSQSRVDADLAEITGLPKPERLAAYRQYLAARVEEVQAELHFNNISDSFGGIANALNKDTFSNAITISASLGELSESMTNAINRHHDNLIRLNREFILSDALADNNGAIDVALVQVEIEFGQSTARIIEESLGVPDNIELQNMKLESYGIEVGGQNIADFLSENLGGAQLRDTFLENLYRKFPEMTREQLEEKAYSLIAPRIAKKLNQRSVANASAVAKSAPTKRAQGEREGLVERIGDENFGHAITALRKQFTHIQRQMKKAKTDAQRQFWANRLEDVKQDGIQLKETGTVNIAGRQMEGGFGKITANGSTTEDYYRQTGKLQSPLRPSNEYGFAGNPNVLAGSVLTDAEGNVVRNSGGKKLRNNARQVAFDELGRFNVSRKSEQKIGVSQTALNRTLKDINTVNAKLSVDVDGKTRTVTEGTKLTKKDRGFVSKEAASEILSDVAEQEVLLRRANKTMDERAKAIKLYIDKTYVKGQGISPKIHDYVEAADYRERGLSEKEVAGIDQVKSREKVVGKFKDETQEDYWARQREFQAEQRVNRVREYDARMEATKADNPEEFAEIKRDIAAAEIADDPLGSIEDGYLNDAPDAIGEEYTQVEIDDAVTKANADSRAHADAANKMKQMADAFKRLEENGDTAAFNAEVTAIQNSKPAPAPRAADSQKPAGVARTPQVVVYDGIEVDLNNDFTMKQLNDNTFSVTAFGTPNKATASVDDAGMWTFTWNHAELGSVTKVYPTREAMKNSLPKMFKEDIYNAFSDGKLTPHSKGGEGRAFSIDWRASDTYADRPQVDASAPVSRPAAPSTPKAPDAPEAVIDLEANVNTLGIPEGRVFAVQMIDGGGAIRPIGRNQTTAGQVLGAKGAQTKYVVGHVNSSMLGKSGGKYQHSLKTDFEPLDEGSTVIRPTDTEIKQHTADNPTNAMDFSKMSTVELDPADLPNITGIENVRSLQDLHNFIVAMETAKWRDIPNVNTHSAALETLLESYAKYTPNGVQMPNSSRVSAFNGLHSIIKDRPADDANSMLRLLGRIGDGSAFPTFRNTPTGEAAYVPPAASARAPRSEYASNDILLTAGGDVPGVVEMLHEVGHWGYFNMLSTQERLTFWSSMKKYTNEDGSLNTAALEEVLPGMATNELDSPAELFANQFSQWSISQGKTGTADEALAGIWASMARKASSFIKRFFMKDGTDLVDQDLIPLFERIIPDGNRTNRFDAQMTKVHEAAPSDSPGHTRARLASRQISELEDIRQEVQAAIDTDSIDEKFKALGRASLRVYSRFGGTPGVGTHGMSGHVAPGSSRLMLLDKGKSAKNARFQFMETFTETRAVLDEVRGKRGFKADDSMKQDELQGMNPEIRALMAEQQLDQLADEGGNAEFDSSYNTSEASSDMDTSWEATRQHHIMQVSKDVVDDMDILDTQMFLMENSIFRIQKELRDQVKRNAGIAVEVSGDFAIAPPKGKGSKRSAFYKGQARVNAERANAKKTREAEAQAMSDLKDAGIDLSVPGDALPPMGKMGVMELEASLANPAISRQKKAAFTRELVKRVRASEELDPPKRIEAPAADVPPSRGAAIAVLNRLGHGSQKNLRTELRKHIDAIRNDRYSVEVTPDNIAKIQSDLDQLGAGKIELGEYFDNATTAQIAEVEKDGLASFFAAKTGRSTTTTKSDIPDHILYASEKDLRSMARKAIEKGDHNLKRDIYRVIKHQHGAAPKKPETSLIGGALQIERADSVGVPRVNGIPANVRHDVEELLLRGTHRDSDIEHSTRTLMYRMLNMMGKTGKDLLSNADVVDLPTLYRLAGEPMPSNARAGMLDMGDPIVNKTTKQVRRMAVGLHKDKADPLDLMHEIGHMIVRATYSEGDMANITRSYEEALSKGNKIAEKMQTIEGYASKSLEDRANEWFVEGWAQYLGERAGHGDIYAVRQGNEPLVLRSTLSTLMDRLVEFTSYALNGLIGRKTVRQQFRELTYFGDMMGNSRKILPVQNAVKSGGQPAAVMPAMAQSYARETVDSFDPAKSLRVRDLVGASSDEDLAKHMYFYGTPNGIHFDAARNPNASIAASPQTAEHGPGVYMIKSDRVASSYADGYSLPALRSMIDDQVPDPADRAIGYDLAESINSNVASMEMARDEIASLNYKIANAPEADSRVLSSQLKEAQSRLAKLSSDEASMWNYMNLAIGVTQSPKVLPLFARAMDTFDFTATRKYSLSDGDGNNIRHILEGMAASRVIPQDEMIRLARSLPAEFTGADLYQVLTTKSMIGDGFAADEIDARGRLTEYLKTQGHDSIKVTERGVPENESESLVIFDPANIKHVEAQYFDQDRVGIYNSLDQAPDQRFAGSVLEDIVNADGTFDLRNFAPLATELQNLSMPKDAVQAIRKMYRGDAPTREAVDAIHNFKNNFNFRSNADHIRRGGAQSFGDFIKPEDGPGFYEMHGADVGKRIMPLMEELNSLPDAGNAVTRWAKRLQFKGKVSQPASHKKISRWLRGEKNITLSGDELKVAQNIEREFASELKRQQDVGLSIGDIRNRNVDGYLPQVWDEEVLRDYPADFQEAFADWFMANPVDGPVSRESAMASAKKMFDRMVDVNGVSSHEVTVSGSDHSFRRALNIDWQDLAKSNPDLHKKLDKFLVDDLGGLMSKYFDQSTRRRLLAAKYGDQGHAFNAYIGVAAGGRDGIMQTLRQGRTVGRPEFAGPETGFITVEHDNISDPNSMFHPIAQTEGHAATIYDELAKAITQGGDNPTARRANREAARTVLLNAYGGGDVYTKNMQFKARVDAIVDGLVDFGPNGDLSTKGAKFMESMMNAMNRKPIEQYGTFGEGMQHLSRKARTFNSVTMLSFTTLTSIPDIALPLIRSGNLGAFGKAWGKYMSDPEYRKASRKIGVSVENYINDRMSGMNAQDGSRFQTAFFNATLLSPWTNMQRDISALVAHEAFLSTAAKAQRLLAEGKEATTGYRTARRFLDRYGLGQYADRGSSPMEADLKAMTDNVNDDHDGLRYAIHRFSNEAIFSPNPNDIPLWGQTPWGALVFQLKSFPTMMMRLSKDVLKEAGQGNVKPLVYMMTAGVGLGTVALAVKDIVQVRGGEDNNKAELRVRKLSKSLAEFGMNEKDLNKLTGEELDYLLGWALEGTLMMGGFGLIAEFVYNAAAQTDNGSWGQQRFLSMISPSVTIPTKAFSVVSGAVDTLRDNDKNYPERSAVREVVRAVPFMTKGWGEDLVDAVAGEASTGKKTGGRLDSKFSSKFDTKGFGKGNF